MRSSVWIEDLTPDQATPGQLDHLVHAYGVSGARITPASFGDGDDAVRRTAPVLDPASDAVLTFVHHAAVLMEQAIAGAEGDGGWLTWWLSPRHAYNKDRLVEEGLRLHEALDRPNLLLEIPTTLPGVAALKHLVTEGVGVSASVVYDPVRFQEVTDAFLAGLEERRAQGRPLDTVQTAVCVSLSPIDALVDPSLETLMQTNSQLADRAAVLHGRVALALAQLTYHAHQRLLGSQRFRSLATHGARPPLLVWGELACPETAYNTTRYLQGLALPGTALALSFPVLLGIEELAPTEHVPAEPDLHQLLQQLALLNLHPRRVLWQVEAEEMQRRLRLFEHFTHA